MAITVVMSCKKSTQFEDSEFLSVEEKNMSVIAKRTWTGCPSCGRSGFKYLKEAEIDYKGKAVVMAWYLRLQDEAEDLFWAAGPEFNLGNSTPTYFTNFVKSAQRTVIEEHNSSPVVLNSNYDFFISGDKVKIRTTTQFFKETDDSYYLATYLIVDGIVAPQSGHPDGSNAEHVNVVADIAKPTTISNKKDFGYLIANGARQNQKVNLEFDVDYNLNWEKEDMSIAIVMFKEQGDSIVFANAFTK